MSHSIKVPPKHCHALYISCYYMYASHQVIIYVQTISQSRLFWIGLEVHAQGNGRGCLLGIVGWFTRFGWTGAYTRAAENLFQE